MTERDGSGGCSAESVHHDGVDRDRREKQGEVRDRVFFFQAEDGIRDTSVTGVQTCALPISWPFCCATSTCFRSLTTSGRPGTRPGTICGVIWIAPKAAA